MRRLVSLSLLLLLAAGVRGQQATNYSNIVTNYLMINPAVTGSSPCMDLKLGIRQQWSGFEGAPTGAFGAIHGTVGEKKRNFHGLGAMVETRRYRTHLPHLHPRAVRLPHEVDAQRAIERRDSCRI